MGGSAEDSGQDEEQDLENYFKAWFGVTSSTGRYSYIDYLDSNYLIDGDTISTNPGATSLTLGFVDPDDYIKAALSSIQRQMKQTFYDESYKDYFASTFDIITTLYEKWSEKYGEPGRDTGRVDRKILHALSGHQDDDNSRILGRHVATHRSVLRILRHDLRRSRGDLYVQDEQRYLFFFESALTSALEGYYESDTSIETIWREALSHIYSGDELNAKVAEKVVEVIEESIAGNIQALETYLVANPGTTPMRPSRS